MTKEKNPRKFHVKSNNGKRNALDGYARLCSSVYVSAFHAIRKAADALDENPNNETALKDYEEAAKFLYSSNPFRNYLESLGHEFQIEKGIEAMENGDRKHLFGKTGVSGRHTDPKKINEVKRSVDKKRNR